MHHMPQMSFSAMLQDAQAAWPQPHAAALDAFELQICDFLLATNAAACASPARSAASCTTDVESTSDDPSVFSSMHQALCATRGCSRRARLNDQRCTAHTVSKSCCIVDCPNDAQHSDYCLSHGGGRCCKVAACSNAAQSQGLCKAHGGGARCKYVGCEKSSQGGGFCRAHGGGKRCSEVGCTKGVQRGNKCATHGGCRTCTVGGCVRSDRGGGYCDVHRKERTCTMESCKRLSHTMGLCKPHLRLVRNQTKPTTVVL
ncbi:Aste57867_2090 [Aphanomyces stellatus]|uniref:Aste57867_2090 protein n=1 Tax=Aphanomyces stellatus TaxID=120398 RepID=A0A485K7D4_9STRA|nr:hypothetical protein As57867_002085 [Aphanomyces stellatus]VFT79293.1 Aste57867_2090 [Aphanomyces stellatus]